MTETRPATQTGLGGARDRKAYYDAAASWSADIHGALRASRRLAWIVAGAAATVAVLEALALASLTPLKTVVPYTITVDRQTGYVQQISGLKPGALTQDQAVTQSFLVQYVLARESFDATDLREDYRKVLLWSAGDARAQYQTLMQRTTPDSPLNLYSPTTMVSVTIKSVSLLSPTTALVRFDTVRHEQEAAPGSEQAYAAVIAFRYTGAPMSMGDRFLNPLGFQVVRYRRDAESLAPVMIGPGGIDGASAPSSAATSLPLPVPTMAPPPASSSLAGSPSSGGRGRP
jgi:type IV secretion system protein VirB8